MYFTWCYRTFGKELTFLISFKGDKTEENDGEEGETKNLEGE